MAVASNIEGKIFPVPGHGKGGGPEGQHGPDLAAGEGKAAKGDGGDGAALVPDGLTKPTGGLPGQIRSGVGGQSRLLDLLRGENDLAVVIGDLIPLWAVHAFQIVHAVAPHRHSVHGPAGGGGEEQCLNGLPLIENTQPVGPLHRLGNLFLILLGV